MTLTIQDAPRTIEALRIGRFQLLCYMTWMLVWFVPAHTRGRVTMGPREADGSRHVQVASCCAEPVAKPAAPTSKDKANCAVCFWAAGLLPVAPVVFEVRPIDVERIRAIAAIAQCETWFVRSDSLARGPPAVPA